MDVCVAGHSVPARREVRRSDSTLGGGTVRAVQSVRSGPRCRANSSVRVEVRVEVLGVRHLLYDQYARPGICQTWHVPVMATPSLADPVTTYVVARLWSGRGFEGEFVLVNVIPRV